MGSGTLSTYERAIAEREELIQCMTRKAQRLRYSVESANPSSGFQTAINRDETSINGQGNSKHVGQEQNKEQFLELIRVMVAASAAHKLIDKYVFR